MCTDRKVRESRGVSGDGTDSQKSLGSLVLFYRPWLAWSAGPSTVLRKETLFAFQKIIFFSSCLFISYCLFTLSFEAFFLIRARRGFFC